MQAKALFPKRIEIDGRVWYIPLPPAPEIKLSKRAYSKRGKRRAKSKSATSRHKQTQKCLRFFRDAWGSDHLKRLYEDRVLRWTPVVYVCKPDRLTPEERLVVQPRFKHTVSVPVLGFKLPTLEVA